MLVFPNCKINIGLNVVEKRADGFHNIETVFYPLKWRDALEIIEDKQSKEPFKMTFLGNQIEGDLKDNLVYKAWQLVSAIKPIPPVKVHLHKNIPMGAGLGGGSADAAFFINLLDKKFELNLTTDQKTAVALNLGSDCPFFIENKAVLATGRGNRFSDIQIDLGNYYILVVYPNVHSNTKEAYSYLKPVKPINHLGSVIASQPISEWKHTLTNDFENYVFTKFPQVKELKQMLYDSGALYASMSGSGSAVFGIFDKEPTVNLNSSFNYFLQNPLSKLLYC